MSTERRVPDDLMRRVSADLEPVRPLPSPFARVAWVALVGMAVMLAVLTLAGVREDAPVLGMWLTWGAAAVEMVAGLVLVGLALREAIPGRGSAAGTVAMAVAGGAAVQVAVAIVTWMHDSGPAVAFGAGAACFADGIAIGVPPLLLTLWLAARAYPVRPRWAGLLGGTGSGLLADGIEHTICPVSDLRHVLVWHAGAFIALAAIGYAAGLTREWWARRRAER